MKYTVLQIKSFPLQENGLLCPTKTKEYYTDGAAGAELKLWLLQFYCSKR
jgi:hypothetical protein